MDISVVALMVSGLTLVAVLFLIFGKKSTGGSGNKEMVSDILLGLNQNQTRQTTQLIEEVNKGSQNQQQMMGQKMTDLERRFGELQVEIIKKVNEDLSRIQLLQTQSLEDTSKKFAEQTTQVTHQFTQIKEQNQQSLQSIQTVVQERLSRAIQDLSELNNKNFQLLSQTNQQKLEQIQGEIRVKMDEQLMAQLKSFETVQQNLGHMQATAQQMIESTKSVDKLNTIFERTSSKAFGSFGEQYLESLLQEHVPHNYQKQVTVPGSSDKIDFVLSFGDKKIGIDSKLPMTKYQDFVDATPDTKKVALKAYLAGILLMAQEIATKYLKPGFLDFLVLYLPSDSMYNEVVNDPDCMEKLHKLRVQVSSPSTIFPLILLINTYQFRISINENAQSVIEGLQVIKKAVVSFQEEFRKLGDKIRQAQQNYDIADKNLMSVQSTVTRLELKGESANPEVEGEQLL